MSSLKISSVGETYNSGERTRRQGRNHKNVASLMHTVERVLG